MVNSQSTPPAEGAELQVRGVTKTFTGPDGRPITALQETDLSVPPGTLFSLVGPSGCGKSTLLRMIAGLETPDSGELRVGDQRISAPCSSRGLVFQDPNLFPWLTVRGNIRLGPTARGVKKAAAAEVEDFLKLVGLESFAESFPHHLSGGMAQRAALARALINHPQILLLDEPLGALDAFTRMRMQDEVLRLWQARGTTMVLVTHDIDEAIYMSDTIVIMTPRPGKIQELIPVELPRPRDRSSADFLALRARILKMLHFAEE